MSFQTAWNSLWVQPVEADRYGKRLMGVARTFVTVAGDNMSHSTNIKAAESHSLGWIQFHLLLVFYKADVASKLVIVSSLYSLP